MWRRPYGYLPQFEVILVPKLRSYASMCGVLRSIRSFGSILDWPNGEDRLLTLQRYNHYISSKNKCTLIFANCCRPSFTSLLQRVGYKMTGLCENNCFLIKSPIDQFAM